jgi:two-component system, OmpR family, sensor histidine kinase MprB
MTLRARLALALGLLAALAASVVAVAAYRTISDRLYAQVDTSLASQTSRLSDPDGRYAHTVCDQISRSPTEQAGQDQGQVADLTGTDIQCLDASGSPFASTEPTALPVTDEDRRLAAGGTAALAYATTGSDRIVTIAVPGGGAVQVARDLDEVDEVLDALRTRLALLGLGVTLLAVAAGWFIARRITRPIVTLTTAAEQIAVGGALDVHLPPGGTDETGRLARAFETMLDALRGSRAKQQALVQDAGHELRTPLTALRTNVDVLRRHPDLPAPERVAVVDDIGAELRELSSLAEELVTLAMEDNEDEDEAPVDLAPLARRAAARLQRRTGREVTLDVESSVVPGRPRLLLRALDNLLDNAAKFDATTLPIELTVGAGRIVVRDHGPGVSPNDADRIFDRFYRAPTARTEPGSGLGLAIVRDIVAAHQGDLTVANAPGGGAAFTILLPTGDEWPAGNPADRPQHGQP